MQNQSFTSSNKRIYFDNNATTFPSARLRERWSEILEVSGNASSVHHEGRQPKTILRDARKKIAELLSCSPLEIIFNSGASEGNSSIFNSVFQSLGTSKNEFIVSSVEHPSVAKAAESLKLKGAVVHLIPAGRDGRLDLEFVKAKLSEKTALVSVMYANNETGVLHPIKEIAQMAHEAGALMHTDCVQMLGKCENDFKSLGVDYASFSAHKFYSLKGTGFCYIKSSAPWMPLIFGSQERGRRGGTENMTGIAALNIVLDEFGDLSGRIRHMSSLRDLFESKVKERIKGVTITAQNSPRVSNTSSLVIEGVDGDTLLMSLDLKGFSVSTGAACSSGSPEPSPVLLAMGLSKAEAQSSLRISVGWTNTEAEVLLFVDTLSEVVSKLREMTENEKKSSNVR
jgi:cysteine desulfurase